MATAKKMGRPVKTLNDAQVQKVRDLAARLTKKQISDYFGISHVTFMEIEKRQPEVAEAYQKGKSEQIDEVAGHLLEQCRKGNIAGIIFYLKTQAGWTEDQSPNTTIPVYQKPTANDDPDKAAV